MKEEEQETHKTGTEKHLPHKRGTRGEKKKKYNNTSSERRGRFAGGGGQHRTHGTNATREGEDGAE